MPSIRRMSLAAAVLALPTLTPLVGCATPSTMTDAPAAFGSSMAAADVAGLSCPLCAESLIATVEGIDGVESAWLDLEAGRLTMSLGDTPPTPAEVAASVERAGFTLVAFRPAGK